MVYLMFHIIGFGVGEKRHIGNMTLYKGDSRTKGKIKDYSLNDFKCVSAHEFGHFLGLDDLYNKSEKIRSKHYCIMGNQWETAATGEDIEKVITAFGKNSKQTWR